MQKVILKRFMRDFIPVTNNLFSSLKSLCTSVSLRSALVPFHQTGSFNNGPSPFQVQYGVHLVIVDSIKKHREKSNDSIPLTSESLHISHNWLLSLKLLTACMKKSSWSTLTIPKLVNLNTRSMIHMRFGRRSGRGFQAAISMGTSAVLWWFARTRVLLP